MMNTPENSSSEDCGINEDAVSKVLPGLYFFIFIPALVLNVTVMWILMWLKTESTFMVYLKNLVAADLLMTLVVPVRQRVSSQERHWACGCLPVFYQCMYISIILMGLICLDRFFKVVRPEVCGSGRGWPGQSVCFGWAASATAWMAMLLGVALPSILLTNREPSDSSKQLCIAMKDPASQAFHAGVVWAMNLLFWAVLILIGICYAYIARTVVQPLRISGSTNGIRKRKTKAKVFIVLAVFLVCFAPYHIVCLPYSQVQSADHSCRRTVLNVAKEFALWLYICH